jgi:hypothetical protein
MIYVLSLIAAIFVPNLYIPYLTRNYKERIGILDGQVESESLLFLSKRLGEIERMLFWLAWFLFQSQFITLIGFWLALKVAGNYKNWGEKHQNRGNFIIFLIGTALSIISVIIICWVTGFLFPKSLSNPFNRF